MPTKRIPMPKIIDVLRLKHDTDLSHEKIAKACDLFKPDECMNFFAADGYAPE